MNLESLLLFLFLVGMRGMMGRMRRGLFFFLVGMRGMMG
jgi:hypothetical protein